MGGEDVIDSINEPLSKDKLSALGETLELRLRQAELRLREAEVDLKKAEIDDRKQDREERKKYAIRIFGLLIGYIFFRCINAVWNRVLGVWIFSFR